MATIQDKQYLSALNKIGKLNEHIAELEAQLAEAQKDSERLDWFQNECFGGAIISDDDGYFTVCGSGMQNCRVDNKGPLETTFFADEDEFFNNVRDAIDSAREEWSQ